MEVHHHSHTTDIHRGRKKWNHYFREFLMLFLAVFCGFLAEYQLEHMIERDREKQFIQSLLEDLRADTVSLAISIDAYESNAKRTDSLMKLLSSSDIKNRGSDLYYLGRRASRSDAIVLHDRTIQQMKNSGGFRLIRNVKVSNTIIEYYNSKNSVDMLLNVDFNTREDYRNLAIHIFHPLVFDSIITEINVVIRPQDNPSLLTNDQAKLLSLAGVVGYLKSTRIGIVKACADMRNAAIDLIMLIKKEYHLK